MPIRKEMFRGIWVWIMTLGLGATFGAIAQGFGPEFESAQRILVQDFGFVEGSDFVSKFAEDLSQDSAYRLAMQSGNENQMLGYVDALLQKKVQIAPSKQSAEESAALYRYLKNREMPKIQTRSWWKRVLSKTEVEKKLASWGSELRAQWLKNPQSFERVHEAEIESFADRKKVWKQWSELDLDARMKFLDYSARRQSDYAIVQDRLFQYRRSPMSHQIEIQALLSKVKSDWSPGATYWLGEVLQEVRALDTKESRVFAKNLWKETLRAPAHERLFLLAAQSGLNLEQLGKVYDALYLQTIHNSGRDLLYQAFKGAQINFKPPVEDPLSQALLDVITIELKQARPQLEVGAWVMNQLYQQNPTVARELGPHFFKKEFFPYAFGDQTFSSRVGMYKVLNQEHRSSFRGLVMQMYESRQAELIEAMNHTLRFASRGQRDAYLFKDLEREFELGNAQLQTRVTGKQFCDVRQFLELISPN